MAELSQSPLPSPRRWIALAQLSLLTCLNCCQWINFATIVDEARDYFGVTNSELNWLSVVYMVVYVVLEPVAVGLFERFGLRKGLLLCSALNLLGAAMKLVCALFRLGFGPLFAAQFLAACAQIFSLGSPPLLSSSWFPPKERTLATAITSTCNTLGNAIGLLVPPLLVTSATRGAFASFFGAQLAMCVVDVLINVFLVTAPPTAVVTAVGDAAAVEPVWKVVQSGAVSLLGVLRYRNFTLLSVATALMLGVFWSLSTFSAQLLQPFGASETQVGGMGFTSIALGSVGSLIVCPIIDRVRRYWLPTITFFLVTALCGGALAAQLCWSSSPSVPIMWLLYSLLGMLQTTAIPVLFEFAAELSYPVDTSVSGGMLMMMANFMAAVIVVGLQPFLGNDPSRETALRVVSAFVVIYAIAAALVFMVPEDLRRLRSERATPVSAEANPSAAHEEHHHDKHALLPSTTPVDHARV